MSTPVDIMLLVAGGVAIPVAVAFHVFFSHSRQYHRGDKLAAAIFCLCAVASGTLHWILLNSREYHLTRDTYDRLVGTRGLFGGICIGIALSLSLAHAHRKKIDKPEQVGSSAG